MYLDINSTNVTIDLYLGFSLENKRKSGKDCMIISDLIKLPIMAINLGINLFWKVVVSLLCMKLNIIVPCQL